jgi:hypothetical protein
MEIGRGYITDLRSHSIKGGAWSDSSGPEPAPLAPVQWPHLGPMWQGMCSAKTLGN